MKTIEKIDIKVDEFFDWLNSDGQSVLKSSIVFGTLLVLVVAGSFAN